MAMKRLLLLLKPLDVYPTANGLPRSINPKVVNFLEDRRKMHDDAIRFCQNLMRSKFLDCETVFRTHISEPVRNVDLVVTVGGDGTLLHTSHFVDSSVPVLGVNSDPTNAKEVEEFSEEFDATRSTGLLCAATVENFENMIDDILNNRTTPSEVARMSISVNSKQLTTPALNDVLIAHPCPATVSRLSFRIRKQQEQCSSLVSSRSSGFRASTAAGSTAAMLSAGGFQMPILSRDLQYMVREPISPSVSSIDRMHGVVKDEESVEIKWFSKEGMIYIDGSHNVFGVEYGDTIVLSSKAPMLNVFLPSFLLSKS